MPTRNRKAFIPRAVAMFLAQDYPGEIELIIIEDGEQDSASIATLAAQAELDRLRYFRYERFTGSIGAKLNRAAQVACGSILIRWDDDDWNALDRIGKQVAHMQLSGKAVVGMSSLIFYAEGEQHGYEYTGDAWYASGSSHCYTREWALAHPYQDISLGEDNAFIAEAHKADALSTVSGLRCLVACDHAANTSARAGGLDAEFRQLIRDTADNFRRVPLADFQQTIGPHGSH